MHWVLPSPREDDVLRRSLKEGSGARVSVRKLQVDEDPSLAISVASSDSVSGVFELDEPLCLVSRLELARLEHAAREYEESRTRWWTWVSSQGLFLERRVADLISQAEKRFGMPLMLPNADSAQDGTLTLTWMREGRRLRVVFSNRGGVSWFYDDGSQVDRALPDIFFAYLRELGLELPPEVPIELTFDDVAEDSMDEPLTPAKASTTTPARPTSLSSKAKATPRVAAVTGDERFSPRKPLQ